MKNRIGYINWYNRNLKFDNNDIIEVFKDKDDAENYGHGRKIVKVRIEIIEEKKNPLTN